MKRCRRILYRQEQTHTLNAASRPKELSPVYDLLSSACKFCQETTRCFSVNYNSYVDSWENPRQTVLPYPANEVAFVEPFSSLKNRVKFPGGFPTIRKIHDEVENMLTPPSLALKVVFHLYSNIFSKRNRGSTQRRKALPIRGANYAPGDPQFDVLGAATPTPNKQCSLVFAGKGKIYANSLVFVRERAASE